MSTVGLTLILLPFLASVITYAWLHFWQPSEQRLPVSARTHRLWLLVETGVAISVVLPFVAFQVWCLIAAAAYAVLACSVLFLRSRVPEGTPCGCWAGKATPLSLRLAGLDAMLCLGALAVSQLPAPTTPQRVLGLIVSVQLAFFLWVLVAEVRFFWDRLAGLVAHYTLKLNGRPELA